LLGRKIISPLKKQKKKSTKNKIDVKMQKKDNMQYKESDKSLLLNPTLREGSSCLTMRSNSLTVRP